MNAVIINAVRTEAGRGKKKRILKTIVKAKLKFLIPDWSQMFIMFETIFHFIFKVVFSLLIKIVFIVIIFRQLCGREQSYHCSYSEGSVKKST